MKVKCLSFFIHNARSNYCILTVCSKFKVRTFFFISYSTDCHHSNLQNFLPPTLSRFFIVGFTICCLLQCSNYCRPNSVHCCVFGSFSLFLIYYKGWVFELFLIGTFWGLESFDLFIYFFFNVCLWYWFWFWVWVRVGGYDVLPMRCLCYCVVVGISFSFAFEETQHFRILFLSVTLLWKLGFIESCHFY